MLKEWLRRRILGLPRAAPWFMYVIVGVRQVVEAPASYSINFDSRHDVALSALAGDLGWSPWSAGINDLIGLGTHEWGVIRHLDPVSIAFMKWGPVVGARMAAISVFLIVGIGAYLWALAEGLTVVARDWCVSVTSLCVAGGSVVPVLFPDLYAINTSFPMYVAGSLIVCAALVAAIRATLLIPRAFALVTLILLAHWWAIVYTHYLLLMGAPVLIVTFREVIAAVDRRRAIYGVARSWGSVMVGLMVTGTASYVAGFFGYTAAVASGDSYSWSPRSLRPFARTLVDVILPQHALGPGAGMAVIAILVAVAASTTSKAREVRGAGLLGLIGLSFALIYRISERFWWRELGPSSAYISWILFPFLVPPVVLGLRRLLTQCRKPRAAINAWLVVALLGLVVFRAATVEGNPTRVWWNSRGYVALERVLGATRREKGSTFVGRAVFMPNLASSNPLDAEVTAPFAESLMARIPLLNQHSHLQSPAFVDLMQALLARPDDPQRRAHLTLRVANRRLLDLFGVRYLITDRAAVPDYPPAEVDADLAPLTRFDSGMIFVSDSYNDGSFSPTRQRRVDGSAEVLEVLAENGFDPKSQVVVTGRLLPKLVAADRATIRWTADGLRVDAKSAGHSLLVLPWEYSHCWRITNRVSATEPPQLVAANGILVGVLFEHRIDAELRFVHRRMFGWRDCRLADLAEYRKLRNE